jgi:hypothetical protein
MTDVRDQSSDETQAESGRLPLSRILRGTVTLLASWFLLGYLVALWVTGEFRNLPNPHMAPWIVLLSAIAALLLAIKLVLVLKRCRQS